MQRTRNKQIECRGYDAALPERVVFERFHWNLRAVHFVIDMTSNELIRRGSVVLRLGTNLSNEALTLFSFFLGLVRGLDWC